MASYMGLHYPRISFRSDWLKIMSLYWDTMGRMLPPGYPCDDDETVQRLTDVGFVRNYDPTPYTHEVGDAFIALLEKMAHDLEAQYGIGHVPKQPMYEATNIPPDQLRRLIAERPDPFEPAGLSYMDLGKVDPRLLQVLLDTDLVIERHLGGRDWLGMHPMLWTVYTVALAETIARRKGLHPVAGGRFADNQLHLALSGCTMGRIAQALGFRVDLVDTKAADNEMEGRLAMLTLQYVVPMPISHLSIETILHIRREFAEERVAFQDRVRDLVAAVGEVSDVQDVQDLLENAYRSRIEPELKSLQTKLESAKLDWFLSAMNVQVALPPLLGGAAVYVSHVPGAGILVAGGALSFAALRIFRDKRKRTEDALASKPGAAYLYYLQREAEDAATGMTPERLASELVWTSELYRF